MSADTLETILRFDRLEPVYQPIVDLYSGSTVGYEALARGPAGPLERPDRLFAAARESGRLEELDRACRRASVRDAHAAGLRSPSTLFINVEPEAIGSASDGEHDLLRVPSDLRVVVEITERALTSRPAHLLHAVEAVRSRGLGIALDDVGADRRSLALMPFLRPDVIKLDLRLTQDRPSAKIAEIHNAVSAQAERTGAVVLAEGIETAAHAERARAMGASLGQGWLLGRPGPLPAQAPMPARPVSVYGSSAASFDKTPFRSVQGMRPQRRGAKGLLLEISRELERRAHTLGDTAVVISTFQERRHFTASTRAHYERLAKATAFVGAIGAEMGDEPALGVRGAELRADDPLTEEWDIVVLGPHFGAAFTARDLGDRGVPDMERRFDFTLTHDRELVVACARTLMSRIAPLRRSAPEPQGVRAARRIPPARHYTASR